MTSVGFGLSPASGHAIRDLVMDGRCSFADLDKLKLARFAGLPDDWREARGWIATTHVEGLAALARPNAVEALRP